MSKGMMQLKDTQTGEYITDCDTLMLLAKLDPQAGFEGIALMDDETPIVCDRCGSFGYLDSRRFEIVWTF